jgi:hypothetical protein
MGIRIWCCSAVGVFFYITKQSKYSRTVVVASESGCEAARLAVDEEATDSGEHVLIFDKRSVGCNAFRFLCKLQI